MTADDPANNFLRQLEDVESKKGQLQDSVPTWKQAAEPFERLWSHVSALDAAVKRKYGEEAEVSIGVFTLDQINRWWKGNLAAKAPNKVPLVLPAIIQGKMIWIKDRAFEMEQGGWRSAGYGANEIQLVTERLDRRLAEYFGS